jgi:uncharacterized protein YceH (UPF0502 family)
VIDRLIERELVARLARRPGQREERYMHLLGDAEPPEESVAPSPAPVEDDRLARIERELAELRAEVEALREAIGA